MKLMPMLAVASLFASAAAFAQTPPPPAPMDSPPPAAAAPVVKHHRHSLRYCRKHAKAQNLTGADRTTFIKSCRAGNAS